MTNLFIAFFVLSVSITSCSSVHHVGCPGKDQPSFKGRISFHVYTKVKLNPITVDEILPVTECEIS